MEKEELIQSVQNGFSDHNQIKIISLEKDEVILEVELSSISYNPYLTAHGGLLFGLADNAMGYLLAANDQPSVTVNSSINYLKPANGSKIIAKATPVKIGKAISFVKCELFNDQDEVVANAEATFYKI